MSFPSPPAADPHSSPVCVAAPDLALATQAVKLPEADKGRRRCLAELEKKVMDFMSVEIKPSIDELCEKTGKRKSTIYNTLKSLREKGYIS